VPSPKVGPVLAVSRPRVAAKHRLMSGEGGGSGQDGQQFQVASASVELLEYAMFKGTHTDCAFDQGESGNYLYVSGRRWPRQRKHWLDTTCDATTVIIQEVERLDGSHVDRVYLLYDGRPSSQPPAQVTVSLVNNPSVSVVLTCGSLSEECYTETSDGITLTPKTSLHTSGLVSSSSAAMEAFVDCVRNRAGAYGIREALRWQNSSGGESMK
jgi:hypothetical protein